MGLAFISWMQGAQGLTDATLRLPLVLGAAGIFLAVFVVMRGSPILLAYAAAMLVWLIAILVISEIRRVNIAESILGSVVVMLGVQVFLGRFHDVRLAPAARSPSVFAIRAASAGAVVAAATVTSSLAGPEWGGVMAAFPAVMSVAVIIVRQSYGPSALAAVSRGMVFALFCNILFAGSTYATARPLGPPLAILVSYSATLMVAAASSVSPWR